MHGRRLLKTAGRCGRRVAPVAALLAAACLKVPQQSASLAAVKNAAVTATQLQLRVYEAGRRLSSLVEAAADSIAGLAADPLVRRRALLWKTFAIPLVQEASLQNEPVVAAVDLWGFTVQQVDYFERGDGRDAFGPLQPIALATARELEQDARRTVGRSLTTGEVKPEAVEAVKTWAARHPIRGAGFRRESALSSDWKMLGIRETSLFGTVASLDRTLVGVTNRLGYINEGMLKQVRWNAELMADEALAAPRVDSMLFTLTTTTAAMGDLMGAAPSMLDRGREAVFRDLSAQQVAVFAALDRQRIATLGAITDERAAVVDALREERVAVLDALHGERIATLAAVDSIAQRSLDHVQAIATRLLLLTLVAFVVMTAIAVVGVVGITRVRRVRTR